MGHSAAKALETAIAADDGPAASVARRPSAGGVLASLALCMLLPALATSIANVALPTLAVALDASFQQVQWVVIAYLLATTATVVSAGRLGDRVGRRRLLIAGIALFTAASVLCGVASGLWMLIAGRAAQGLGAAVMMALTLAFVGQAVPKSKTGSAMGLLGTMSAVGTALGPSLGGLLIDGFGWPSIFCINLPLGIVAIVLAWRSLPADRRATTAERGGFDGLGTLLLALTLAAYALAMTMGRGSFGRVNIALLLAAVVGVALFVRVEARAASPLIQLARFRDPAFGSGLAMNALVSTVMMATLVVGPFNLVGALGLDMAQAGLAMSVGPAVAALAGVPAGRLVDRFGATNMTATGLAAMAVGCSALAMPIAPIGPIAPAALGFAGFCLPMAVATAGYALFQVANNTAVMADVAADQRGAVSGMLTLSRNLGLVTGASLMGAVFAVASRAGDAATAGPGAIAAGMRVTFGVAVMMVVVALGVAFVGRRRGLGESGC